MSVLVSGIFGLTALFGACTGNRDNCDLLKTWVQDDALHISGLLNAHAYSEILTQLDDNPEIDLIVLENIPGTLNAVSTLRIAAVIHARGIDTHLPADGFIESGGVDLFCAGVERTAEPGAHVGVHSWWGEGVEGADIPKWDSEHIAQREYFEQIGCPVSFYTYTLRAAPGNGMYIMNRTELVDEGVVTKFVKRQPR